MAAWNSCDAVLKTTLEVRMLSAGLVLQLAMFSCTMILINDTPDQARLNAAKSSRLQKTLASTLSEDREPAKLHGIAFNSDRLSDAMT